MPMPRSIQAFEWTMFASLLFHAAIIAGELIASSHAMKPGAFGEMAVLTAIDIALTLALTLWVSRWRSDMGKWVLVVDAAGLPLTMLGSAFRLLQEDGAMFAAVAAALGLRLLAVSLLFRTDARDYLYGWNFPRI